MPSPCPRMLHRQYGEAARERQPFASPSPPPASPVSQSVLDRLNLNVSGHGFRNPAEHYVAVPPDRSPSPVQRFQTFTPDLVRLADWLAACGVTSVAMESTGVYWIPIFELLEARGLEVHLVNARHIQNVPGRKSDVADCQWIQRLHSYGFLAASFRPEAEMVVLRAYLRQRAILPWHRAAHTQACRRRCT